MTTNKVNKLTKVNKLVVDFLDEHAEESNLSELWMGEDVQKSLKTLCAVPREKVVRKKKDPNAPKRGKSAYLFFCADRRESVKESLGAESKATDVTRRLGELWNQLKDSKKASDKKELQRFEAQAAEDKTRYEGEKAEYVPVEVEETEKPKRRGGKKKDSTGPKRGQSAYLFFCAANRAQVKEDNPDFKATEVTSELGRLWNMLKDDPSRASELQKFVKMAEDDKARYEAEKADAAPAPAEAEVVDAVTEEEVVEEEVPVEPTPAKKSGTGFVAFSNEKRTEFKKKFPKAKAGEVNKKLSAAWKALSKDEQQAYKN